MSLVTLSGVISPTDLNTNFTDKTSTLLANMKLGNDVQQLDLVVLDLTNAVSAGLRTLSFTPDDDWELQVVRVSTKSAIGSLAITATLTCSGSYLLDQTISVTATTSAGAKVVANGDYRTSPFIVLKKGVTYTLTLSSASASVCDLAQASILAKVRRRYR